MKVNPRMHKGKTMLVGAFCMLVLSYLATSIAQDATSKIIALSMVVFSYALLYAGIMMVPQKHYAETFTYLKKSQPYIWGIIALFAVCAVLGFILAPYLSFFDTLLKDLLQQAETLSGPGLIEFIFLNNAKSAFSGLFGGIALGLPSLGNAILNGAVLGYVFARVYEVAGVGDFWRLLPHGIFELPAIFISLGVGLRLGCFFISKTPLTSLKERFFGSINVYMLIVIPLLIVAAIIEGLLIMFVS